MKLVGELKEKVEKAESMDEAKQAIENAGMELTNEELKTIAGGGHRSYTQLREEQAKRQMIKAEATNNAKRLINEMNTTLDGKRKQEILHTLQTGNYMGVKYRDIVQKIDPTLLG